MRAKELGASLWGDKPALKLVGAWMVTQSVNILETAASHTSRRQPWGMCTAPR